MKFSKKTKLVFILVAVFLIGLAVPSYSWTRKNVKEIETFYNSKLSPIIMIPGSSATENRFDGLVRKLNQDRRGAKHSLLKVKVWNNGRITFDGKIKKNDNEPIIVIGFENNNDGYSNIKKQAKMMNQAFEALQNKYNFNNFKGLAHSNGGLIYTDFIENYLSDYDVKINSLMTIGTPYNFTETNIKNKSVMLADFIAAKKNIPSTLHVYSVAMTRMSWFLMLAFQLGSTSIRIKQRAIPKSLLRAKMPSTRTYQPMMKLWNLSNNISKGKVSVRSKRLS